MNKLLRTILVLASFALTSALFAGARTFDLGAQDGSFGACIEMYLAGDYNFQLVNNDTGQVVANISTVTSFDYNHFYPDWVFADYYAGSSGSVGLSASYGTMEFYNVPAGNYSLVVSDSVLHNDWYSLSSIFLYGL